MLRHMLIAAVIATSLAPLSTHAQDGDWGDSGDGWGDERSPDYDVSVDVGVSGGVTFDTFYAPLGAYGEWVSAGAYGRVWRPNVDGGWRPYYNGRWEWTNEGWFWVSDEPWGWAAYHYGRWAYDGFYGWVWVPGYQWAPAWVSWRWSGDVVGWAPLAPGLSVYVTSYPFYDSWWTFVPSARFVSVPVYSVAYGPRYTRHYFDRTAPAPARPAPRQVPGGARPAPALAPAWGGPAPRAIEARLGRPLRPARVIAAPSPAAARAGSGEISVYRPDARPAPGRGRGEGFGRPEGRGPMTAPAPGRSGERGDAFTPPGRQGPGAAPGPRGWTRPERVAPAERDDRQAPAAPWRGEGGARGWTRPERAERGGSPPAYAPAQRGERGGGPPAYAPAQRGERGGGAPAYAPEQRGGGSGPARAPAGGPSGGWHGERGGGAQPPARPSQQQGSGGRPAPAPHRD